MTPAEARSILTLYRPGTADAEDPQMAEALALAQHDAELGRWLEEHCARQAALRQKFQSIPVPLGLKEQIISEEVARQKRRQRPRRSMILAGALCAVCLAWLTTWYLGVGAENTLTIYKHEMVGLALRGYGMDLNTNSLPDIRAYLAKNDAPADFKVTTVLQQATVNGCAIESWESAKVSMVCFHTAKTPDKNNMWLFVIDQSAVRRPHLKETPTIERVHGIITASWIKDGKLYLLGAAGDESDLQKYL